MHSKTRKSFLSNKINHHSHEGQVITRSNKGKVKTLPENQGRQRQRVSFLVSKLTYYGIKAKGKKRKIQKVTT